MAIDTPARIIVLGAGPIGLEAALYGRFLGYDVEVIERGAVAENMRRWGHLRLFTPFKLNSSPLGIAALRTQDPDWKPPADETLLTGRELVEMYLEPLAASDLLADSMHLGTEVLAIGRAGPLKHELVKDESRGDFLFRVLTRDAAGQERVAEADIVIDASGTYGRHNGLGQGGIPASGEPAAANRIEYGLPDPLGDERALYAGAHTLVVGDGYAAAATIVALSQLASEASGTRIAWITRPRLDEQEVAEPIQTVSNDPHPPRDRLLRAANAIATDGRQVDYLAETTIELVRWQEEIQQLAVVTAGKHAGAHVFDRIVADVGHAPDQRLYEQLQVQPCYATGALKKLGPMLMKAQTRQEQPTHLPGALIQREPNFYVLGAKSYGHDPRFLLSIGLEQIRELFAIIGDREGLNLYQSIGV